MYFYLVLFTNTCNSFSLIDWIANKRIINIDLPLNHILNDFKIIKFIINKVLHI